MSAIVDFEFYSNEYMGTEADESSFPALCRRASDVIASMARWQISESNLSSVDNWTLTLYKKAICAQIDFFAINGLDSVSGISDRGFTVGKVSISGRSGADTVRKGAMSAYVSPMAIQYLEQTGLLNPSVPIVGGCVC